MLGIESGVFLFAGGDQEDGREAQGELQTSGDAFGACRKEYPSRVSPVLTTAGCTIVIVTSHWGRMLSDHFSGLQVAQTIDVDAVCAIAIPSDLFVQQESCQCGRTDCHGCGTCCVGGHGVLSTASRWVLRDDVLRVLGMRR